MELTQSERAIGGFGILVIFLALALGLLEEGMLRGKDTLAGERIVAAMRAANPDGIAVGRAEHVAIEADRAARWARDGYATRAAEVALVGVVLMVGSGVMARRRILRERRELVQMYE